MCLKEILNYLIFLSIKDNLGVLKLHILNKMLKLFCFCFVLFWGHTQRCSGIIPGGAVGEIGVFVSYLVPGIGLSAVCKASTLPALLYLYFLFSTFRPSSSEIPQNKNWDLISSFCSNTNMYLSYSFLSSNLLLLDSKCFIFTFL